MHLTVKNHLTFPIEVQAFKVILENILKSFETDKSSSRNLREIPFEDPDMTSFHLDGAIEQTVGSNYQNDLLIRKILHGNNPFYP